MAYYYQSNSISFFRSVCLSVLWSIGLISPLVTSVIYGKTADSIEMPFEVVGRVDPRNDV